MADLEPDVKTGSGSKAGMIAIATALITAATTVSVAYITRSAPAMPSRNDPAPSSSTSSGGGSQIDPAPQPAPQPFMQTTRNVAGVWAAQDGEQLEIAQSGTQLTLNGGTMTQAGAVIWQGYGRINDRDIKWTAQVAVNSNQVEAECAGRLTTGGNSLQGTCDLMGQKIPFIYSR